MRPIGSIASSPRGVGDLEKSPARSDNLPAQGRKEGMKERWDSALQDDGPGVLMKCHHVFKIKYMHKLI